MTTSPGAEHLAGRRAGLTEDQSGASLFRQWSATGPPRVPVCLYQLVQWVTRPVTSGKYQNTLEVSLDTLADGSADTGR